jgi:hypothetical protein
MNQRVLFHDSIYDALGGAVQAAGGVKRVSAALWPALSTEVAAARLRSGLNPEHAQKLCPSEVLHVARLAREAGDHSVMQYLAAELGYRIEPVSPRDELADALESFDHKADALLTAIAAVKRAQVRKVG